MLTCARDEMWTRLACAGLAAVLMMSGSPGCAICRISSHFLFPREQLQVDFLLSPYL